MSERVTAKPNITQQENRMSQPPPSEIDPRIRFFDGLAPDWDRDGVEIDRTLSRLREIQHWIGLAPNQSVLELGCGTGRITGWITTAVHPGKVVGADFSQAMLKVAQGRGLHAEFRLMDICGRVSEGERFDVVLCFNAFPHFRDQEQALQNISRMLKPKGRLIILHLVSSREVNEFHARLSPPVCHDCLPSRLRFTAMIAGAGLALESLTDEPGLFLLIAKPAG